MPGGRKKAGKKRVAAYARISCVKDAMLHSLSAQVSYFSNLIQRNRGELPQYLVHDAHEPIIDRETFDAVQRLTAIRIAHYHPNRKASRRYPFSGILRCDQCGSYYSRKITMAGTPYSKPVWICATYNMKGRKY